MDVVTVEWWGTTSERGQTYGLLILETRQGRGGRTGDGYQDDHERKPTARKTEMFPVRLWLLLRPVVASRARLLSLDPNFSPSKAVIFLFSLYLFPSCPCFKSQFQYLLVAAVPLLTTIEHHVQHGVALLSSHQLWSGSSWPGGDLEVTRGLLRLLSSLQLCFKMETFDILKELYVNNHFLYNSVHCNPIDSSQLIFQLREDIESSWSRKSGSYSSRHLLHFHCEPWLFCFLA